MVPPCDSHRDERYLHLVALRSCNLDRRQYVQRVLDGYLRNSHLCGQGSAEKIGALPTASSTSRIPLRLVEAAFYLAAMRRLYRPFRGRDPLAPIRSLHYFLPVLDEIRQQNIDPDYIGYAKWKVRNAEEQIGRIRRLLK